jgi:CrcB protein
VLPQLAIIALGGACGAVARYGVQVGLTRALPAAFPFGTLAVNVTGCLAFGALVAWFGVRPVGEASPGAAPGWSEAWQLALLTGFLGAYTTFSTFSWETIQLLRDGHAARALAYILASNALSLAAAWAGYRAVQAGV